MGERIALLAGIPSGEDGYFARVKSSDYLAAHTTDPNWFWKNTYQPFVAGPLNAMMAAARGIGIHAVENATLASLAQCSAAFDVVIILSHMKGPEFSREDILNSDKAEYLERLEGTGATFDGAVRDLLAKDTVEESLSKFVDAGPIPGFDDGARVQASPLTLKCMRRDFIDARFGGLITPGNRIEFYDTLASKEDIEQAVAAGFCGTLDLTTCTSSYMADYISRRRGGTVRVVHFLKEQDPELTCIILERAFALHSEGGGSFYRCRQKAELVVRGEIRRQLRIGN